MSRMDARVAPAATLRTEWGENEGEEAETRFAFGRGKPGRDTQLDLYVTTPVGSLVHVGVVTHVCLLGRGPAFISRRMAPSCVTNAH